VGNHDDTGPIVTISRDRSKTTVEITDKDPAGQRRSYEAPKAGLKEMDERGERVEGRRQRRRDDGEGRGGTGRRDEHKDRATEKGRAEWRGETGKKRKVEKGGREMKRGKWRKRESTEGSRGERWEERKGRETGGRKEQERCEREDREREERREKAVRGTGEKAVTR
jgi:hypothetical protein